MVVDESSSFLARHFESETSWCRTSFSLARKTSFLKRLMLLQWQSRWLNASWCRLGTCVSPSSQMSHTHTHNHHPALPASILLAMLSVALCWRWPYEAAIFILTCAGTLRIGEVLQARRSDLILPSDAAPGQSFIPSKTRGRSARHHFARVDQPDIIQLLSAAYEKQIKMTCCGRSQRVHWGRRGFQRF